MKKILIVACALVACASTAHSESFRFQGLMCKSAQAIENVLAISESDASIAPLQAIAEQNKANPGSCMVGDVEVEDGNTVKTFKYKDIVIDVKEETIIAVCQQSMCVYGEPDKSWFIGHLHHEGDGA